MSDRESGQDAAATPEGWGNDAISEFIETARRNTLASFDNLRPIYEHLGGVERVFRVLIDNASPSPDWFAIPFLLRAHSAFLGALRLGLGGQVAETYPVLRTSLESALYGLHTARRPGAAEAWLRRDEDEAHHQAARSAFRISEVMKTLESESRTTHGHVQALYDRTIEFGGHPNLQSIMSNLRKTGHAEYDQLDLIYLTGDGPRLRLCLKTCAQTGLAALEVFRCVFPERFDLLGLSERLGMLKRGL